MAETGKTSVSFEFFPPSTEQGEEHVIAALDTLSKWKPDFFSVTYGAGGGSSADLARCVHAQ